MVNLAEFTFDFGDGPIMIYGRRMNLREARTIAEHKKLMVSFDNNGNKVTTVTNPEEWLTNVFLTLAKDSLGMRMFGRAEDADRVWTKFAPDVVYEAAGKLLALEAPPGN